MRNKKKIIRACTVPQSIGFFEEVMVRQRAEGYETVVVSSPGAEFDEFRQRHNVVQNGSEQVGVGRNGIRCIEIPMERHISLWKDGVALLRMIGVFMKERPYVVHSMTPKAGLLCMTAAWLTGVPVRIHTFTGLVWPTAVGTKRKILMLTDKILCACATHIIPEGEGVKNDLQQHITKKPMKVLGYGNARGVDMVRWSGRQEVEAIAESMREKDVFTFVFVGRIVGDKGINELVEAFIRLLCRHSDVRLILVGPYENDLDPVSKLTQERINNTPEIEAVGSKSGDELAAYYAASDCFVFPSYREGFPNTVLEAGAMGLPSIVTDINGSREIIIEGENGIIIPSKDVDALYIAMLEMIDNPEQTKRMADNARPMIESRYEQGFVRKCQMEFYDEILG